MGAARGARDKYQVCSRSERESDDSGFEEEEEEEDNKEVEKIGLTPFLGLAVGSMLVGTSVGYCQAR